MVVLALEFCGLNSSFQGLKFVWLGCTAPMQMVRKEISERYGRNLDIVGNGYRLCILRDLNGWIGHRRRAGISGAFGVPGENDNGRRVMEFYAERGHILSTEIYISTQEWQGFEVVWRLRE